MLKSACAWAFAAALLFGTSATVQAQSAQPSAVPSPAPSVPAAAPAQASPAAKPFSLEDLTPAQREALQAAIVKITQNPVGTITIIPFQNNFNSGVGPYSRFQYNLNVQPAIPVMLTPDLNLIVRVIMPIIDQPSNAPPAVCASAYGCGSTFGIGDFNPQFYFAPKTREGGVIWGAGPQFLIPTANPGTLGTGKWSAGPTIVGLVTPGPWVTGVLVNQLWSFAGQASRPNVSSFLVQPFVNYNLKHGWTLTSAPIFTANWLATSDKWAAPIGGGVNKTFKAGEQVMQLGLYYYTYLARPLGTPQTTVRVQWNLVFPLKRGIDIPELIKQTMEVH